ncbi:MAG: helix-turn-helix domain-containing protein, partial [Bacilli bacterium]|nr:helix-turn-helix domain-containing protein [Bacilli bacterium]
MNYNTTNKIKKPYKHLNKEDRIKIEILYSQNKSCTYIANFIGFHKSTISRELR